MAPALATASDVPPIAKLPQSTGSMGSAGESVGGNVLSVLDVFFPVRQRVVAKHFIGLKHVLTYRGCASK